MGAGFIFSLSSFMFISVAFVSFQKARTYADTARAYQQGIDDVLWNEEAGIWFDYDIKNNRQRNNFYPTNLTPLYTKSFDPAKASIYAREAVDYIKQERIGDYMGKTCFYFPFFSSSI